MASRLSISKEWIFERAFARQNQIKPVSPAAFTLPQLQNNESSRKYSVCEKSYHLAYLISWKTEACFQQISYLGLTVQLF